MAKQTATADKVPNITPIGRVSYPNVYKPRAIKEGDDPKFSVTLLFPKDTDLTAMKEAAAKAAKEKWGEKPPKGLKTPFKDGNEKEGDEYQDMIYVQFIAKETRPPQVVNGQNKPIAEASGDFYPGCWARATYNAYAWEHPQGGKGVSFGLGNIQKIRDDEPFDGRRDAVEEFGAIEATEEEASDLF